MTPFIIGYQLSLCYKKYFTLDAIPINIEIVTRDNKNTAINNMAYWLSFEVPVISVFFAFLFGL